MNYVRKFAELGRVDAAAAGGKGASLGEMTHAGILVPPGFVVTADAFEYFLRENNLHEEIDAALHRAAGHDVVSVERASEEIQALICGAQIPVNLVAEIHAGYDALGAQFVAVRSSATAEDGATAAWAGQLESFLNTDADALLENVRRCWASLFTPRAIVYAHEKNLHETHISVAVVVQAMVASEISGIAFSVHPVSEDYNQMIIEAGLGLGEAIVSGQITPDSYIVEKSPRVIREISVGEQTRALFRGSGGGNEWQTVDGKKPKLNEAEILDLAEIVVRIESHYGFPCDIEWAREGGKFYIVQSRPITTLSGKAAAKPKDNFYKAYTRDFSIIVQEIWYQANAVGILELLGIENHPHIPPYIFFMKDGVIEVWENEQAYQWLRDRIVEKINTEPEFSRRIEKEYYKLLERIAEEKNKTIDSAEQLENFVEHAYQTISHFLVMYATLLDDRIPEDIKQIGARMRETDALFDDADKIIRRSLHVLHPDISDLLVCIMHHELGTSVAHEELQKRNRGFALIAGEYAGATDFKSFIALHPHYVFELDTVEDLHRVTGQVVYRGKITGRVRILKRKNQVGEVGDGDIIISPMTTPDFMPAMQKAAAFVTDEGGITCHAAIIARELKKPCVIGTRVATEVFRDGDVVEVDAENGIVRRVD